MRACLCARLRACVLRAREQAHKRASEQASEHACVRACACTCKRARTDMRACMPWCMRACMRARRCTHARARAAGVRAVVRLRTHACTQPDCVARPPALAKERLFLLSSVIKLRSFRLTSLAQEKQKGLRFASSAPSARELEKLRSYFSLPEKHTRFHSASPAPENKKSFGLTSPPPAQDN